MDPLVRGAEALRPRARAAVTAVAAAAIALALALALAAAPRAARGGAVELLTFHVRADAPALAALTPQQRALIDAYKEDRAGLSGGAGAPAEGFSFDEIGQAVLPGRVVHATAWAREGHEFWMPGLLYVHAGRIDVVYDRTTNLDGDGYDRRLDALEACAPSFRGASGKLFDGPAAAFDAAHDKLKHARCFDLGGDVRAFAARALAKPDGLAAAADDLVRLLTLAVEPAPGARVLHDERDLSSAPLRKLVDGADAPRARWHDGVKRKFHAPRLTAKDGRVTMDALAQLLAGPGSGDQLLEAHLVAGGDRLDFELESLASTIVIIE